MKPDEFRRLRRGILDMSQRELAAHMGVTRFTIRNIEKASDEVKPIYRLALEKLVDLSQQTA